MILEKNQGQKQPLIFYASISIIIGNWSIEKSNVGLIDIVSKPSYNIPDKHIIACREFSRKEEEF